MDPYEVQPEMAKTQISATNSRETQNTVASSEQRAAYPSEQAQLNRISHVQAEQDPVLRTLVTLQRQQQEQTRLLRQLLQEVEALKDLQNVHGTTVEKLDRRLKRARFWRLSWLFLRWALFLGVVAGLIYLIGPAQLRAIWQRVVWLLT